MSAFVDEYKWFLLKIISGLKIGVNIFLLSFFKLFNIILGHDDCSIGVIFNSEAVGGTQLFKSNFLSTLLEKLFSVLLTEFLMFKS